MEILKLHVTCREWSKLSDFVEMINAEDEMGACGIDGTTAVIATQGSCGTAWVEAQIATWFEDSYLETIKK